MKGVIIAAVGGTELYSPLTQTFSNFGGIAYGQSHSSSFSRSLGGSGQTLCALKRFVVRFTSSAKLPIWAAWAGAVSQGCGTASGPSYVGTEFRFLGDDHPGVVGTPPYLNTQSFEGEVVLNGTQFY